NFERDLARRMTVLADVIGENSVAALVFRDEQAAAETLWALHNDPRIVAGAVYDTSGRPLAQYLHPEAEWDVPASAPALSPDAPAFREGTAVLVRPAELRGERRGTVYLAADTAGWREALRRSVAILVTLFGAVLAVGFIVSVGLQRLVTGPILDLASLMRRIGRTRAYDLRAVKRGNDE